MTSGRPLAATMPAPAPRERRWGTATSNKNMADIPFHRNAIPLQRQGLDDVASQGTPGIVPR